MNIRLREYQRRSLLPLAGLALALYYAFVFVPLGHRAQALDAPLQKAWQNLSISLEQANTVPIDFRHITNQLFETRQALATFETAKQKAMARLELGAALRARLNAPFQLVDYENERSKQMDELTRLAKQQQISVSPAVLAGFPEHTADVKQPALLWAALSFIDGLLTTAIQCQVGAIHSLQMPLALTNSPAVAEGEPLAEIPIQVDFTGTEPAVAKLLQLLPLRGDELKAAGHLQGPADKLPLFIDRLIIRKQSPDKPDEVRVSLRVVGFVLRE